jgi:hypothetical protein
MWRCQKQKRTHRYGSPCKSQFDFLGNEAIKPRMSCNCGNYKRLHYPNYLLKYELVYEFGVRGIRSDTDVAKLRKLFRTGVSEGLRVEVSNLREVKVN